MAGDLVGRASSRLVGAGWWWLFRQRRRWFVWVAGAMVVPRRLRGVLLLPRACPAARLLSASPRHPTTVISPSIPYARWPGRWHAILHRAGPVEAVDRLADVVRHHRHLTGHRRVGALGAVRVQRVHRGRPDHELVVDRIVVAHDEPHQRAGAHPAGRRARSGCSGCRRAPSRARVRAAASAASARPRRRRRRSRRPPARRRSATATSARAAARLMPLMTRPVVATRPTAGRTARNAPPAAARPDGPRPHRRAASSVGAGTAASGALDPGVGAAAGSDVGATETARS